MNRQECTEYMVEKLIVEYLSKCKACDECFAQFYCIEHGLRTSRTPKVYCPGNIKMFLRNTVEKCF